MKPVLFVGHSAGYTGAPILLLNFLRWLRSETNLQFSILLRETGPLAPSYAGLSETFDLGAGPGGFLARKLRQLGLDEPAKALDIFRVKRWLSDRTFSLTYSNTVTNHDLLPHLVGCSGKVLTHIHELESWIKYQVGLAHFMQTKAASDHWIAVSKAVRDNLWTNHGVPPGRVDLIYGFIDIQAAGQVADEDPRRIRREIGLPENALVVCGSGTTDWRKGPDLFVDAAAELLQVPRKSPLHFIWVGGSKNGKEFQQLQERVRAYGIERQVHFLGHKINPLVYFSVADVFALTSREDPYPLVMLESAALGLPVVAFDGSGGAPEFIEDDCGLLAAYGDVSELAAQLGKLLDDPVLRLRYGRASKEKVKIRHDIRVTAPKILAVIKRLANG